MIATNPSHLQLPADQLFWSVLDVPAVRLSGALPDALLPEFADDVPVPLEELFVIAAPTTCGKTLACAATRSDLEAVSPEVLIVTPESVPPALGVAADTSALNFLIGPFEPSPLRRRRQKAHIAFMLTVAALGGLVMLGVARRSAHFNQVALSARSLTESITQDVLPGQDPVWADRVLDAELADLRAKARAAQVAGPLPDAALHFSNLLGAWPAQVPSKPQSIAVTSTSMMVSVAIDGDASNFLRAMKPPPGWTLAEPRINAASGITRVSLQMKPVARGQERTP